MTRDEKMSILDAAIDRGFQAIRDADLEDLTSKSFSNLLENLLRLGYQARALMRDDGSLAGEEQEWGGPPDREPEPAPTPEIGPEPADAPGEETREPGVTVTEEPKEPAPEKPEAGEEPEESAPEKAEGETFKPAEVRATLASARLKGVNVVELLRKFGAGNFSALPESRYADVMLAVKQELANVT